MVFSSLLVWLFCALITVVTLERFSWALGWIGFSALFIQFVYGCLGARMVQSKVSSVALVPIAVLLLRGSMASCAIFLASIIVATGHSTLAGVASVFPAIFLTVMVSVWLSQGPAIPSQAAGTHDAGKHLCECLCAHLNLFVSDLWRGCGCTACVGTFSPVCVPTSTSYFEGH